MDEIKTIETINVTDPSQVDQDPVIESMPEEVIENEEQQAEAVEETEAPVIEDKTLDDVPAEETPDPGEFIGKAIESLSSKIEEITSRIEALAKIVDNINKLEEARAAGPSGFFKPIGGDNEEPDDRLDSGLPRIERIYK